MKRLLALDAFRGFTVAGMILVNVPGTWSYVYRPLLHAQWNGLTLADLVFPFFVFIMGVSVILAFTKALEKGSDKKQMHRKIINRSLIIFAIGIVLNLISYRFQEFRIPGVLQRIAIVYCVISFMFLYLRTRIVYVIGAVLLVAYWLLMVFVPIPGELEVSLEPGKNWSNYLDGIIIPYKLYGGTWDPEGLLSTIPSVCTAILGLGLGDLCLRRGLNVSGVKWVLGIGLAYIVIGLVWSLNFPINKNLWTSSYVMVTGGLAHVLMALFIYLSEIKNKSRWAMVGLKFGANALAAYILHYLLIIPLSWFSVGGKSIQEWFVFVLPQLGLPLKFTSLLWALLFIVICYIPINWMYHKKIFVKV